MAPAEKIKAKIKKTLPVTGPQAPTLKELMHWYCMNTNTHGCRRIVVSRGRLRRVLWIILTLTAVGLILWYCAQLVMNYYTASVSVTVQFQKLRFPAVTICNINPYKYSAIKEHLAELDKETMSVLESLYNFSGAGSKPRERRDVGRQHSKSSKFLREFLPLMKLGSLDAKPTVNVSAGYKRRMNARIISGSSSIVNVRSPRDVVGFQLCDTSNKSDCTVYTFSSGVNAIQEWYKLHYMNIMAQIDAEEKERMSYSAEELMLSCLFDGDSCDARNFTSFHHPLHGNCYTFNSGKEGKILTTSTGGSENDKSLLFNLRSNSLRRVAEQKFFPDMIDSSSESTAVPISGRACSGKPNGTIGLQVILYIEEADYNPFLVTSTGAKIVIHDQDEYPFIEDIGTEIETATATSIGMHFTTSHRLSRPYSNCTEDGADVPVQNLYNKSYSLQICLHSCFQNSMVKTCGCAQYAQPLPAEAEFCNYKKYPNWMYCYYKLHEQFVKEQLGCQQICREACKLKEWTLTTSLAQWPSSVSEEWILRVLSWDKGLNGPKILNKTDLANLVVFYKDLNERFITENPANNIVLLLSNFGGQLGLWMSCSVVCVIEIVEVFFLDAFCIVLRHQWQKAKRWWRGHSSTQDQEEADGGPPTGPEQGYHNAACGQDDDDPPTFNTAMRLSPPQTPPPNYNTLQHISPFSEQLEDTLEVKAQ